MGYAPCTERYIVLYWPIVCNVIFLLPLLIYPPALILWKWLIREDCETVRKVGETERKERDLKRGRHLTQCGFFFICLFFIMNSKTIITVVIEILRAKILIIQRLVRFLCSLHSFMVKDSRDVYM